MNGEIWFQLPPQDRLDWSITVFAAFIITFGGLYLLLDIARYRADKVTTLKRRLGFEQVSNGVFMTISLIWLTLLVTFVFATVVSVTSAVFELATLDAGAETALRGRMLSLTAMIAGLAAVAAFPITLIRMHHAARQTLVAEEQLFNEKLHEASKDLAAWREVTRVVGEDGDERVLTTREPDLVTRATAIDRLYGLIKERPSEASRIAAMLSLYVREHTVQVGDKIPDVPAVPVPENATQHDLMEWADGLQVGRSDLQKAVQAIGRIRDIPNVELEDNAIDLRGANLQAMDLSGLNFGEGQWRGAQMQRTNLQYAKLPGADLFNANLQAARLSFAELQKADLSSANLQASIFSNARLQGANLCNTRLQGAYFAFAHLQGSVLWYALFENSDFRYAVLNGASLKLLRSEVPPELIKHTESVFCDAALNIKHRPKHWKDKDLEPFGFIHEWRDWVAKNHPDVLQYLPDNVRNA